MISTPFSGLCQEHEWLEYFAGTGHLTEAMISAQYTSLRFDLMDNCQPKNRKSNFMNLAHPSGFAFLGIDNKCSVLINDYPIQVPLYIYRLMKVCDVSPGASKYTMMRWSLNTEVGYAIHAQGGSGQLWGSSGFEMLIIFKDECGYQCQSPMRVNWQRKFPFSMSGKYAFGKERLHICFFQCTHSELQCYYETWC